MILLYHKNPHESYGGVEYLIKQILYSLKNSEFCANPFKITTNTSVVLFNSYTFPNVFYLFILLIKRVNIIWVPCFHDFDAQFGEQYSFKKSIKKFIFQKFIIPLVKKGASKIIVFSENEKLIFINRYTFAKEIVQIAHVPISENYRSGNCDKIYNAGFVGRWAKNKGTEIIEELVRAGRLDWIVSPQLPSDIKFLCDRNSVRLFEAPDDENLIRLLQITKIIICPSKSESYGLVVPQALLCGANVIASNCPVIDSFDQTVLKSVKRITSESEWYDEDLYTPYLNPKPDLRVSYIYPSITAVIANVCK